MPLVDGRITVDGKCQSCDRPLQIKSGEYGTYCPSCGRPTLATTYQDALNTELTILVMAERKKLRALKKKGAVQKDDYEVGSSPVISSCAICEASFVGGNVFIVDGEPICPRCHKEKTKTCQGCGEKHLSKFLKNGVCSGCAVSFKQCPSCQASYDIRKTGVFEIDGTWYCDVCVDTFLHSRHIGLNQYSHEPPWTPFGDYRSDFTMGVELEMDNSTRRKEFMARAYCDEIIYKTDGSLTANGIEVVTHPATLEYHMTELPWKHILKVAHAVGYRSHTGSRGEGSGATPTCGFHIHVARNAFGQDQSERDAREAKLLVLFDKFWDKLVIFSRRDRSSLEHWAKRYAVFDVSKDKLDAIIHKAKSHSGTDRRMAVNICNQCGQAREQSTIEFRMFRGTTNYETIIATLQLIHMLVNETLKPTEDIQLLTWEEFRDAGCAKYKEFDGYIKRLQSHKKKI